MKELLDTYVQNHSLYVYVCVANDVVYNITTCNNWLFIFG